MAAATVTAAVRAAAVASAWWLQASETRVNDFNERSFSPVNSWA